MMISLLGLCPLILPTPLPAPETLVESPRVELLDNQQLGEALQKLAGEHADKTSLLTLCRTGAGNRVQLLRISAGEETDGRPAILLVAALDGTRAYTSSVALDHARSLLAGYGEDEAITSLLDNTTLYVVPRANPDVAGERFRPPLLEQQASGRGIDNDRDGRLGEDAPEDLDGDGLILSMRVRDPEGEWMEDPADPRVMIKADRKKGERGVYRLHVEGRDSDGDEEVNEDSPLDAVLNRNFPCLWEEHAGRAGLYPTSEPEVLALADFVLKHEEIAVVISYGALGNLVEKPEAIKKGKRGSESPGTLDGDLDLMKFMGKSYREITKNKAKGSQDEAGSFESWCYQYRGLLTLRMDLWAAPAKEWKKPKTEEGAEEVEVIKPSEMALRLQWLEENGRAQKFHPWKAFDHPELGSVEIGGLEPYSLIEPTGLELDAIADAHLPFLLEVNQRLPRVVIAECKAIKLGEELYRIEAVIENNSLMPLQTASAENTQTIRPARLSIALPSGAELLGGKVQELVRELKGLGGRKESSWLVKTSDPGTVRISVDTPNAGTAQTQPEVN